MISRPEGNNSSCECHTEDLLCPGVFNDKSGSAVKLGEEGGGVGGVTKLHMEKKIEKTAFLQSFLSQTQSSSLYFDRLIFFLYK